MSRIANAAEVRRLTGLGMSDDQIATSLGVGARYVRELRRDPDGSVARARKLRRRGLCVDCGGPTSDGSIRRCRACSVGEHHPRWKGGAFFSPGVNRWYVVRDGQQVLRSRVLMEASLGRPLRADEHVHHRNEDKTDDRLENLEVLTAFEHRRRHSPLTENGAHLARQMAAAGFLVREIAEQVGVSETTVRHVLRNETEIWRAA